LNRECFVRHYCVEGHCYGGIIEGTLEKQAWKDARDVGRKAREILSLSNCIQIEASAVSQTEPKVWPAGVHDVRTALFERDILLWTCVFSPALTAVLAHGTSRAVGARS